LVRCFVGCGIDPLGQLAAKSERQAKCELAKRLHGSRCLQTGYHGPWWTNKEKRLLGKPPDG
jgi:hypothetical protein